MHLRAARDHIDARDRALADLDQLDGDETDFGVRRFLGLTAYLGSLWCVYDLAGDFIGRVLLDKDKTKDRSFALNLVATFMEDGKKPGFLPPPIRDVVIEFYAPGLCASYALRNACMHQGLVVHTRAFDGAFQPSAELTRIAEDGGRRSGHKLATTLWTQDLRTSLRLIQGKTDALVGLLVGLAAAMVIDQARFGAVLLENSPD